jgi:hypothetical protein
MAQPPKPPIRPTSYSFDPWKGQLRQPSSGSAAKDIWKRLPSVADPPPQPPKPRKV